MLIFVSMLICFLFSLQAVKLSHWALLRDSIYYTFAITALIVVRDFRLACDYTSHDQLWWSKKSQLVEVWQCIYCFISVAVQCAININMVLCTHCMQSVWSMQLHTKMINELQNQSMKIWHCCSIFSARLDETSWVILRGKKKIFFFGAHLSKLNQKVILWAFSGCASSGWLCPLLEIMLKCRINLTLDYCSHFMSFYVLFVLPL